MTLYLNWIISSGSQTRPYWNRIFKKGLQVIERILTSSHEEITDRSFLIEAFYEYGLPQLTPSFFSPWAKYMNASGFGALQVPTEYIDFLRKLMTLSLRDGIEIGVYRGGFSYFTTAVSVL